MLVEGDQVDLVGNVADQPQQAFGILQRVVYPPHHHILEGHLAPARQRELPAGPQQLLQRVAPVDRHDLLAHLVGGAVQADGEAEAERLGGEAADLGHEATGRNGDAACAEAEAPVGVDDGEHDLDGRDDVVQVVQRLAHAHHDDVSDLFPGPANIPPDSHDLIDNLGRGQIAGQFEGAGQAELAGHGTTDLGGDAQGVAPLDGDQHRLDRMAVLQAEQVLLCPVASRSRSLITADSDSSRRSSLEMLVISSKERASCW